MYQHIKRRLCNMDNNIPVYFMHCEQFAKGYINKKTIAVVKDKTEEIISIYNVNIIREDGLVKYSSLHWKRMPVRTEEVCFSFADLKEKSRNYFKRKKEEYKKECETLQGFLNFPLKYEISGEYADYEAREVYEEMVEKYLKEYKGE